MSTQAVKRLNEMPKDERIPWLASGRLCVRRIQQLVGGNFVDRYIPTLRGIAIRGPDGRFMFDTEQDARSGGRTALEDFRAQLATQASTPEQHEQDA